MGIPLVWTLHRAHQSSRGFSNQISQTPEWLSWGPIRFCDSSNKRNAVPISTFLRFVISYGHLSELLSDEPIAESSFASALFGRSCDPGASGGKVLVLTTSKPNSL